MINIIVESIVKLIVQIIIKLMAKIIVNIIVVSRIGIAAIYNKYGPILKLTSVSWNLLIGIPGHTGSFSVFTLSMK